MKRILVILRHANSLDIVKTYLEENGMTGIYIALDPVEVPGQVAAALADIKSAIRSGVDAVLMSTKVYDSTKLDKIEPPLQLIDFLDILKQFAIGNTPLCLTHLATLPEELIRQIKTIGLNVTWVENDNLKNDRMANSGPLLLSALKASYELESPHRHDPKIEI